jgi:hypothetical protein
VIPVVFVLVAFWLTINTLVARPVESATGLILIALGLPFLPIIVISGSGSRVDPKATKPQINADSHGSARTLKLKWRKLQYE